jgi:alkylhydroperoxidase family enzyme
MALKEGVPRPVVDSLRAGRAPDDSRLAALSEFARSMVRGRGHVDAPTFERFRAAGFTREQALEVVLGMGFSLLANYAHHLTQSPLDSFLAPHAWKR